MKNKLEVQRKRAAAFFQRVFDEGPPFPVHWIMRHKDLWMKESPNRRKRSKVVKKRKGTK